MKVGPLPVAAFVKSIWLTAELVAVSKNNSFPLVSKIEVPILGDVKVLFVKVSVVGCRYKTCLYQYLD